MQVCDGRDQEDGSGQSAAAMNGGGYSWLMMWQPGGRIMSERPTRWPMRSDISFDDPAPDFTLVCPGYRSGRVKGDRPHAGNLTFSIGSQVVAEIGHDDLIESWEAARDLSPGECLEMAEKAADHLTQILDSGLSSADLTEAVTDAAVVLLLSMRRNGVTDPKRIPACTVMWNGHEGRERVFFGA
jgi:hypothetical protein